MDSFGSFGCCLVFDLECLFLSSVILATEDLGVDFTLEPANHVIVLVIHRNVTLPLDYARYDTTVCYFDISGYDIA